jgi:hypothetical protein
MAGEIFVGSVAVGVVPDLRGFNDRIRRELVPSANRIGQDIGKAISKGILDSLNLGDVITKASVKSRAVTKTAAFDLGTVYGKEMRRAIDLQLKGITAKVKLDVDQASLNRIRRVISIAASAALAASGAAGGGGGGGADLTALINLLRGGGGGARGGARGGGGGGILGFLSSFRGGGQTPLGALGALSGPQAGGVAAGIAGAAPFIGQLIGSGIISVLGAGLTGLGIYGALSGTTGTQTTPGQLNVAQLQLRAAQLRLQQLQSGTTTTRTTAPATPLSIIAAQDRLVAAQDRLNKLQSSGKATAAQLASGYASVAGAQNTLNNLQAKGATTTTHHAASAAQLASAQASVAAAQQRLNTLQANAPDISKAQAKMHQAWLNLTSDAQDSIKVIGASFVPVLTEIFGLADKVLLKMTPVFAAAEKVISGPFKLFADAIIKSFGDPQVQQSIKVVAKAFGDILTAFTPDIPGIINSFADAITRIANAVAKNPKAFADFLNFLAQIVIFALDAIAWLTLVADYIELHFIPAVRHFADFWTKVWKDISNAVMVPVNAMISFIKRELTSFYVWWNQNGQAVKSVWRIVWQYIYDFARGIWIVIRAVIVNGWNAIVGMFRIQADIIKMIWRVLWTGLNTFVHLFWYGLRGFIKTAWDLIVGIITVGLDLLTGRWSAAWNEIKLVATQIWGNIKQFFSSSGTWLLQAGIDLVHGLLQGMLQTMKDIGSWIKTNVVDPIVGWVKHFFGIKSPSTVMAGIGSNLIQGLVKGLLSSGKDLTHFIKNIFGGVPQALGNFIEKGLVDITKIPGRILSKLGGIFKGIGGFFAKLFGGNVTGGVKQWAGLVAQALTMLGLPLSLSGQVLYQMQTESGGNPNAINLTDINAQQGDPSRGLLQVIGSTFAAYHVAGTSSNIYDPLANIAAAINYARAVYGPTLLRGGMGMGSGHGYDAGGWLPPGVSLAYNLTGRHERVLSPPEMKALADGSGPQYHAHFDGLTGAAIEGHVRTAFQAITLTQGHLDRQGRRS